jgi:hypothetical protein
MKLMKGKIPSLILGCFCLALFLIFRKPVLAQNGDAILNFESASTVFKPNEVFLVQVWLNAPRPVNTIRLLLSYSALKLKLQDISFNYANFNNVVERKTEPPGTLDLTAFTLSPFQGAHGLVTTLKFQALSEGEAIIKLLPATKVHLNDGQGTDVFDYPGSQKSLSFWIGESGSESSRASAMPNSVKGSAQSEEIISSPTPVPKSLFNFLTGFFKGREEANLITQDREREKVFFPEIDVMDLSKAPTSLEKLKNRYPAVRFLPYAAAAVIISFFGFLKFFKK